MATDKNNQFPTEATRQDFPEVRDKIVNAVEVHADHEYYGITIRFQDNTTLAFTIEPCVFTFPVLADWTDGEEKTLKRYRPVSSKVPRI